MIRCAFESLSSASVLAKPFRGSAPYCSLACCMMSETSEAEATSGKQNGETFNEEMKVRMMERV